MVLMKYFSQTSALPVPGTEVISSHAYGMWVWATQAKIVCKLPTGEPVDYFLKVSILVFDVHSYLVTL